MKKPKGAIDIGLNKGVGPQNGSVNVGLRRKVNNGSWFIYGKKRVNFSFIINVNFMKTEGRIIFNRLQVFQVSSIG